MILRRRSPGRRPEPDALTACRSCLSDYVIPTEWHERGDDGWWMRLRCGECGTSREVVVSDVVAQCYDCALDRGVHEIARALAHLDRERMAKEAEAFATALALDLVDAGDFVR